MTDYETRVTTLTVGPVGQPTFAESVTIVSIDDEGAGEYVRISQGRDDGTVDIDAAEWPMLRDAIVRLLKECRG